jgi:flagellar biosynthesis/type III secretory pathway M-ring protein FliF/YscJ
LPIVDPSIWLSLEALGIIIVLAVLMIAIYFRVIPAIRRRRNDKLRAAEWMKQYAEAIHKSPWQAEMQALARMPDPPMSLRRSFVYTRVQYARNYIALMREQDAFYLFMTFTKPGEAIPSLQGLNVAWLTIEQREQLQARIQKLQQLTT